MFPGSPLRDRQHDGRCGAFRWAGRGTGCLSPLGDVAVDIGANDGTLLNGYGDHARTVAVEPTNQAAKCREGGHRTWQAYFTRAVAADILSVTGPAKAVTACNVLAHVPDPHEAVAAIADLLDDEGVFVSENHDVSWVLAGQWDTVYHEHLRFWSPRVRPPAGLPRPGSVGDPAGADAWRLAPRLRAQAGLAPPWARVAAPALHVMLGRRPGRQHVYGVGATTRAAPLIHFAGIREYLSAIVR